MKRAEAKTTIAAAAASTSSRGRGTRGRGRSGRGRTLLSRSGKIGVETAKQSVLDNFGFGDTEATQAYIFDDSDDDFLTVGNSKDQWKKSSHKGRSCASTAAQKTRTVSSIQIDVDENSHEADDLMSEAVALKGRGGGGQSSRSNTPEQKSRSVTPDSPGIEEEFLESLPSSVEHECDNEQVQSDNHAVQHFPAVCGPLGREHHAG